MTQINLYEAKTHLSQLVDRAAAGEDIVIGKAGRPLVRLIPYTQEPPSPRTPGAWAGRITIRDDFDALPDDFQDAFEGKRP